ncbi:MAG: hypothetical protein PF638_07555 [Candidatus Delongbacteria bacterium]|jgi:hypothetical protein|nr:hypothetical protein [Candidatus Delongbacteria bacterium]
MIKKENYTKKQIVYNFTKNILNSSLDYLIIFSLVSFVFVLFEFKIEFLFIQIFNISRSYLSLSLLFAFCLFAFGIISHRNDYVKHNVKLMNSIVFNNNMVTGLFLIFIEIFGIIIILYQYKHSIGNGFLKGQDVWSLFILNKFKIRKKYAVYSSVSNEFSFFV